MLYIYAATEDQGKEFLETRFPSKEGHVIVWPKFQYGRAYSPDDTVFFLAGAAEEMVSAVKRSIHTSFGFYPKIVDFRDIERKTASVNLKMKVARS